MDEWRRCPATAQAEAMEAEAERLQAEASRWRAPVNATRAGSWLHSQASTMQAAPPPGPTNLLSGIFGDSAEPSRAAPIPPSPSVPALPLSRDGSGRSLIRSAIDSDECRILVVVPPPRKQCQHQHRHRHHLHRHSHQHRH